MHFTVSWRPRPTPLEPSAVVAWGATLASKLGRRLLEHDDEALARWRGVAGPEVLLALGPDLPWIDGVQYLGSDPAAPGLLLPTTAAPTVPAELLAQALRGRAAPGSMPLAVLPDPPRVVPTGSARPIDRPSLSKWLRSLPDGLPT